MKEVAIYCDGSGTIEREPCGFAAILIYKGNRKEITGSLDNGTNNVAELMAAIIALESLKEPCKVTVTSDSEYVVLGMKLDRAKKWRSQRWLKKKYKESVRFERFGPAVVEQMEKCWEKVPNWELWSRLLDAAEKHEVTFQWVRGHAGHPENSRCDKLAGEARRNHKRNDTNLANAPSP